MPVTDGQGRPIFRLPPDMRDWEDLVGREEVAALHEGDVPVRSVFRSADPPKNSGLADGVAPSRLYGWSMGPTDGVRHVPASKEAIDRRENDPEVLRRRIAATERMLADERHMAAYFSGPRPDQQLYAERKRLLRELNEQTG